MLQTKNVVLILCGLLFVQVGIAQKKMSYNSCLSYQLLAVDTSILEQNKEANKVLNDYQKILALRMNDTLGINALPLTKALPESSLGNMVADAVRHTSLVENEGIDVAIVNYGSISKEYVAPGAITRKDCYEIIERENTILLFSINGNTLKSLCDSIARNNGLPVSGIEMLIKNGVAEDIKIDKQVLKPNKMYRVAMNDYLANSRIFRKILEHTKYKLLQTKLRDAFIIYLQSLATEGKKIRYVLGNRIVYAE